MADAMRNLTGRVPEEVFLAVDELADAAGLSRSEYVRRVFTEHVDAPERDPEANVYEPPPDTAITELRDELRLLKQAVGQVLVMTLINLPDEQGERLPEQRARQIVGQLLSVPQELL